MDIEVLTLLHVAVEMDDNLTVAGLTNFHLSN